MSNGSVSSERKFSLCQSRLSGRRDSPGILLAYTNSKLSRLKKSRHSSAEINKVHRFRHIVAESSCNALLLDV